LPRSHPLGSIVRRGTACILLVARRDPVPTRDAVRSTLEFVRCLAAGTQIVFEVLLPDCVLPESERKVAQFAADASAARGEPWLSRYIPEEMGALLAELGYRSCSHLTPVEAQARYFQDRRDGLRAPVMAQLLIGTV
jgi:O-methyltransferase involved in polyketide biosynthesis